MIGMLAFAMAAANQSASPSGIFGSRVCGEACVFASVYYPSKTNVFLDKEDGKTVQDSLMKYAKCYAVAFFDANPRKASDKRLLSDQELDGMFSRAYENCNETREITNHDLGVLYDSKKSGAPPILVDRERYINQVRSGFVMGLMQGASVKTKMEPRLKDYAAGLDAEAKRCCDAQN